MLHKILFINLFIWYPFLILAIDKVVIWGHKLHTHTHSYIHERFYNAFNYLGYETFWLDENDDILNLDLKNCLFITEGQVDKKIPLLKDDSIYILHNCDLSKYQKTLNKNQFFSLNVYTDDVLNQNINNLIKIDNCVYFDIQNKIVYMPWASDLLPHEIEEVKKLIFNIKKSRYVFFNGTIWDGVFGNINQITPFIKACKKQKIPFLHKRKISRKELLNKLMTAYMAPTILGEWQVQKGYIPCRIFINISAGQMPITNSYRVFELFNKKITYNPNTYELFFDAKKRLTTWTIQDQYDLMDFVKEKQTYLNRIEVLFNFIELLKKQ